MSLYYYYCVCFTGETTEPSPAAATHAMFKVGDKVRVDLEIDILRAMQEGHGGWNPRMAEVKLTLSLLKFNGFFSS